MLFHPVEKRQFILSQFGKYFGFLIACTQFCRHLFNFGRNTGIICMFVKCFKQIQFGIFFNFNAQVIKLFNRCVACQEVQRSGTKADDFEFRQANQRTCNRKEFIDHISTFFCCAYRIFRNICLDVAQL